MIWQVISNSDLEEIRELGSGNFGTVFYGKWRGSDVAIKRLKPICLSGGESGEEKMVNISQPFHNKFRTIPSLSYNMDYSIYRFLLFSLVKCRQTLNI